MTPEGKSKGRKLLVNDYQTYVYDDAEEQKIIKTFGTSGGEGRGSHRRLHRVSAQHPLRNEEVGKN